MLRTSLVLAGLLCFHAAALADPAADEAILKKAGVSAEGPALLKFLGGFVPGDGKDEDIPVLVKKMGSDDFFEREDALKKVIALGPRAAPFLKAVLKEMDRELVSRAEECLKIIEGAPGQDVHGATLRLIALKKPVGAAAVVLEYLPFAPNERIADEAAASLGDVALEGGKPAPALGKALSDKFPARRAAAAQALARIAFKENRGPLLKLLNDDEPRVQHAAAAALALKHEKDAVPVLIALLEKLPAQQPSIEIMLQKLADYKGPPGPWTSSAAMRDAWQTWWKANAATADLAKLTTFPKMLGHTLLVHANSGRVQEIDKEGKTRWEIGGLQFPMAAEVIGDDRVLIVENRIRKVTVRNFKGDILRTINVTLPTDAQALPGGNILVVSRLAIYEYGATAAIVRSIRITPLQAAAAVRLPTGHHWVVSTTGVVVRLDNAGKELSRFSVGAGVAGGGIDVTPEGRILLTDTSTGRVLEYDGAGKLQREWKVPGANHAVRLANGNTLVACPGAEKVVEIDERGNVVWQFAVRGDPVLRASRR